MWQASTPAHSIKGTPSVRVKLCAARDRGKKTKAAKGDGK